LGFAPDIVHVHDWQTALASAYLKIWHWNDPLLGGAASVLTIHNIAYQGKYPAYALRLSWPAMGQLHAGQIRGLRRGQLPQGRHRLRRCGEHRQPDLRQRDAHAALGYGLAPYLNDKGENYVGILNGVDYAQWNPAVDKLIPARYSPEDMAGKRICKAELQRRFLLDVNPNVPIVGVVSRLVGQKGLDLLAATIERIVSEMVVQFVVLGSGDKGLESFYGDLPRRYPGRIGSFIGYSNQLAHWIEAGADFFIMPSIYEPCGLNQIYSLKYGTLPIVRATGGLDDTVIQYDERTGDGTGFKFWEPSPSAIFYTVGWAVSTFYDRPQHMSAQPLGGGCTAGDYVHHPPFVEDGDAVGEGENLVQVFGDEQRRTALAALLQQPFVDVLRGADVHTARRLRRHQHPRVAR
jgi:starch synthase